MNISVIQRTNGPVNVQLKSGPSLSTKRIFGKMKFLFYTNFGKLESLMLHAKFQDHRAFCSGEEAF